MPHDALPEGAAHWILGVLGAVVTTVMTVVTRFALIRMRNTEAYKRTMEKRVVNLERLYAVHDARHRENLRRFDELQTSVREMDRKLDRLIERR